MKGTFKARPSVTKASSSSSRNMSICTCTYIACIHNNYNLCIIYSDGQSLRTSFVFLSPLGAMLKNIRKSPQLERPKTLQHTYRYRLTSLYKHIYIYVCMYVCLNEHKVNNHLWRPPALRTCQMYAIARETDIDAKMSPPHMLFTVYGGL